MSRSRRSAPPADRQINAQITLHKYALLTRTVGTTLQTTITWGGYGFLGLCAYWSIAELAGKTTVANVVFDVLGQDVVKMSLAYFLAICGIAYGLFERYLRRTNIARMSAKLEEYEKMINPEKGTSGLTIRGTTPGGRA